MNKELLFRYLSIFLNQLSSLYVVNYFTKNGDGTENFIIYSFITSIAVVALMDGGHGGYFTRYLILAKKGFVNFRSTIEIDKLSSNFEYKKNLDNIIKGSSRFINRICLFVVPIIFIVGFFYFNTKNVNALYSVLIILLIALNITINLFNLRWTSYLYGFLKIYEAHKAQFISKVFLVIFLVGLFISDNFKVEFVIATFCLSALIGSLFFIKYCDFAKNFLTEGIYCVKKSKYFDKIFFFQYMKGFTNLLSAFLIHRLNFFIFIYFALDSDVKILGVISQFGLAIFGLSNMFLFVLLPRMLNYIGTNVEFKVYFVNVWFTVLTIFILLTFGIIVFSQFFDITVLNIIWQNKFLFLLYILFLLLELNQNLFNEVILMYNKFPFLKASLITGFVMFFLVLFFSKYLEIKPIYYILIYGIVNMSFNNWYWVIYGSDLMNLKIKDFRKINFTKIKNIVK